MSFKLGIIDQPKVVGKQIYSPKSVFHPAIKLILIVITSGKSIVALKVLINMGNPPSGALTSATNRSHGRNEDVNCVRSQGTPNYHFAIHVKNPSKDKAPKVILVRTVGICLFFK